MPNPRTQPLPVEDVWPLFRRWCEARLHGGLPWLQIGWSRWIADDFASFLLKDIIDQRLRLRASAEKPLAYDVEPALPALAGSSIPVALVLNRNHPQHPTWLVDIDGQSHHDTTAAYLKRLEAQRERLSSLKANPGFSASKAAIIAITVSQHAAEALETEAGFNRQFQLSPDRWNGDRTDTSFTILSASVDREALGN